MADQNPGLAGWFQPYILMSDRTAAGDLGFGSPLEAAIEAVKAVSGRVALDEPGELTEVASLKAEVARLTEENNVLRDKR